MGRKQQVEPGSVKGGRAVAPSAAAGLEPKRHRTPEERRAAVEAFERSGLTQAAFARQWGVSPVTLGKRLQRHAARGPKALERLAEGPPKRRGKAPLPEALKAAIVAAKRAHPGFGLKRLKAWLWRLVGVKVPPVSVPLRASRVLALWPDEDARVRATILWALRRGGAAERDARDALREAPPHATVRRLGVSVPGLTFDGDGPGRAFALRGVARTGGGFGPARLARSKRVSGPRAGPRSRGLKWAPR